MRKGFKSFVSILLCMVVFLSVGTSAFAKLVVTSAPEVESTEGTISIIDEAELNNEIQVLVDQYTAAGYIDPAQIAVAYTYLNTGDTWYLNPDMWFYSASMYKVPLMMLLAERERAGELTQDSLIENVPLSEVMRSVLVDSSNDRAHASFRFISGKTDKRESEKAVRPLYMQYSKLPETYYHSDFVNYSYFSARFMNDVMCTLYNESARFPNVIELLKQSKPENYYHLKLGNIYEIAQKYGYYEDSNSNKWHNNTGIIYTPNPFVLTVMTNNAKNGEQFMGDLAELFANYTLALDSKLAAHKEEIARVEAEKAAAIKAEEEAKAAQLKQEQEAAARAEAEKKAQEEARIKEQKAAERAAERKVLLTKILKIVGVAGGVVIFLIVLIGILTSIRKRKAAAEEEHERRMRSYDEGDEVENSEGENNGDDSDDEDESVRRYKPRTQIRREAEAEQRQQEDDEDEDEDGNGKSDEDEPADRLASLMRSRNEKEKSAAQNKKPFIFSRSKPAAEEKQADDDKVEDEDEEDEEDNTPPKARSGKGETSRRSGGYVPRH